jgi:LacI family transcriptional regulator
MKYARLHGPWAICRLSEFYWKPGHRRTKTDFSLLKDWGVDGIITRDMDFMDELLKLNVPIIGSDHGEAVSDVPLITGNHKATGEMAATYFINKGFKNYAFCGYSDQKWSTYRMKGFTDKIEEFGYTTNTYQKPLTRDRRLWKNEPLFLVKWLKTLPERTAIMTCSDDRALHVLEACNIAKIKIPEQIAVLGVDNDDIICELANPPISSIKFNVVKAGYKSAATLNKLMFCRETTHDNIVVEPIEIVTRLSTDILGVEDRDVISALSFIREHRNELIQVQDVADAVSVSRRTLEVKFRRYLNKSLLEEIKQVHIDQMVRMLLETNLPVSKIALILGHNSSENISRYFKYVKGLSPKAFREKYGSRPDF